MATQELKIKVSVDAQTGELKVVGDEVDDLGKKAKDSSPKVNTLRQGVEDLANTGLALNFLKSAFGAVKEGVMALLDTAGEFEKYKTILTTLEGSSEKAETSFAWVKEFSAKTPYELSEVTKAFVKLKSYGIDPTDGTLKMLGDTSAAMGKDLNSAVEMMADALTGENERLKEYGIKASAQGDYIKYVWTNSSGEAKQAIVQNNAEIIKSTLGAIFNDKYQGSMDLLSNTWVGLTSNMADNWTQFKSDLAVNSGLFDGAKEAVRTFNKEFSTITSNADYMNTLGTSIKWGAVGIIQAVQGVSQVFTGWAMIWKGLELGYEQLKLNVSIMTDQIALKITEAQAKMDSLNPFSSTTAQEWDVAIKTQQHKINQQIAATYALDEQYSSYVKNLDSSNKIFDNLQDSFLKNEKSKQDELNTTAETSKKTSDTIIGKTEEQIEAEKKAKAEAKKLTEDYSKWVIDISDKTAKAQADEISKPYVELQLQYAKDLAKYGSFVGAKEKLDVWYAAQLGDINEATAKKADEQSKKESEALEKKQKEEKTNLIASSKQRQDYYEKIEDYASAWAELERVLRLDDTKLTKDELGKKISYEKKAYLESKGIYEDLYSAMSSNITKSTKDWENYNLIVGKGFASMVTNVQTTMQSNLVDVMEGKIKSINTFFTNLWGSVKTSFFNMVAEIATKKIIMSFMNSWASGGDTGKGFVETFLGIDIPFLNFAEGTIWGSGKYGLAGGSYNSVDAYRNDTIPAMISKGEAVIPASAVNKNKSVVSALIAGSRLDNRGLLDVSYVQKIVNDLKSPSMFANGYDPNELGFFDKASIDANGFYNLKGGGKGGGKGGIFGAILGGIIGAFTGGLGSILIGAGLGGGAGALGLLDPIIEMVSTVFSTLMKVPWLGWLVQGALALTAPELIPMMLNADLLSTGITLAMGGNLKQALGGASISGLLAGGGSAISSLIKTGALPTSNLTFWETLQNYPSDLYKTTLDKFSQVKDFLTSIISPSALVNPAEYIGIDQTAWLESGSPLEFDEWSKRAMESQYGAMSSNVLFSGTSFAENGGSFTDYASAYANNQWGFSSYDLIGQPASMGLVDIAREKLLSGLEYAKGMGTTAFNTVSEYLTNPEKIFQYILDNLRNVIENIAVSISSMAGSPLVSALVGSGIATGSTPFASGTGFTAFANGGIVTAPTLGLVGEAGYAEAIIPLHQLGEITGMDEMISELAEMKTILREVLSSSKKTSNYAEDFAVRGVKTR